MLKFWIRTAAQLRQPLACFGAMAAGCFITGHLTAQENTNQPNSESVQASNLDRLFAQDEIEFSPVPPMQPLRRVALEDLLPVATTPARPAEQIPFSESQDSPVESSLDSYPTALASWQEPSHDNHQNRFGNLALSQGPEARVASALASPSPKPRTGVHRLSQVDIATFESAVVSTWGKRITTSSSLDGRYVRVEMPTNVPQRMTMLIDRETGTLNYEGDDQLRGNWHQLMERIDSAPVQQANGRLEHAVLVDSNQAGNAIQQVVFLLSATQDITQPERRQDGQDQITLPPGTVVPQESQIPQGFQGIKNPVKILQDPATGAITLVGSDDDIAIVKKYIEKISKEAKANQAKAKRIPLNNLQSEAIAEQLQEIYDSSYAPTNGPASIEPLVSPNSLIVVGQPAGIKAVEDMVAQMDVEGAESELGGFRAFQLKHMSAADARARLQAYFSQTDLGGSDVRLPTAPVIVIADYRSNTVIVKGSKQFIQQAEEFLKTIDVNESEKTNVVKVFPLRNTLAEELSIVIQDAINGQQQNSGQGFQGDQQGQQLTQNNNNQSDPIASKLGSSQLSLSVIDNDGRVVKGGIMFDVRVTADRNSNSLVVTGPENSMGLVEALIEKLDRIPDAETQLKVFPVVHGDATTLLTMLETLFGSAQNAQIGQTQGGSNLSQLPLQGFGDTDGSLLVNLRFSVDERTNTIIASGPAGDLQTVEDLLNRLDAKDLTDRKPRVYRLSNAPAVDVAETIVEYLSARSDINQDDPRTIGGYIQAERTAIVVPEAGSNSLLVAASPEQRLEIEELIRGLDRRPPMVQVKVLIAEVDLDSLEEFGVELGIQDSLLFDRGTSVGSGGAISGIGFPFNTSTAGNQNATFQETLAGQALSNLGIGRINNSVGYGGLVLSAGNESVNILMRALKDKQCVRVLSRPHIMTMENLQGRVQIGASVPRVSGTTQSNFGTTQDITFEDVGVILEVTPRVSPDGMIVMSVNAVKSAVGPEETGITIGFGANGDPIRAQQIFETEANTTLMARSGQTVVFSGLIQEEKTHTERGAPILSDLPVIGPLFKFESDSASRTELLIIMTPTLVTDGEDIDAHNQDEMARMHWCIGDVAEVYGNADYHDYQGTESGVRTVYPDGNNGNPIYKVMDAPQPGFESTPPQSSVRPNTQRGNAKPASYSK